MANNVIKFYQFKLSKNTNVDEFMAASRAMDALFLNAEGFIYRSLARLDAEQWQDIVYWDNPVAAAEAEKLMEKKEVQSFVAHIDVASVIHSQSKVITQTYPEMAAKAAAKAG